MKKIAITFHLRPLYSFWNSIWKWYCNCKHHGHDGIGIDSGDGSSGGGGGCGGSSESSDGSSYGSGLEWGSKKCDRDGPEPTRYTR